MVPSILSSAISLVSVDSTAYKIGTAIPTVLGLALLIGGLVALLRINRRDRATPTPVLPPSVPSTASHPDAMPPYRHSDAPHVSGMHKPKDRAKEIAIVCLAVGGVIVLGGLANSMQSASAEPERRIVIAETAGGVPRVQLTPEVTATLEQRRSAAAQKGIELQYGGYAHPAGGDAYILFLGGKQQASDPEQSINDFFAGIAESSGVQAKLTEYPAGDLGGEVRCAATTELRCAWADRTTYGMLMATNITEADLAALLIKMRPNLEQPK
ncbi:hypothetical protein [Kribbella catacumbae]|uniref:hypothetical protein n=1 Tax=Kribbella catacumbae TaxID=460086 RepID=UPI00039FAEA2|nr:hypothetical protein [Kribbella catacumbae]